MESKTRRFSHYFGRFLGLAISYVFFVATSPILGLWIIWDNWHDGDPKNVVFADFRKKR